MIRNHPRPAPPRSHTICICKTLSGHLNPPNPIPPKVETTTCKRELYKKSRRFPRKKQNFSRNRSSGDNLVRFPVTGYIIFFAAITRQTLEQGTKRSRRVGSASLTWLWLFVCDVDMLRKDSVENGGARSLSLSLFHSGTTAYGRLSKTVQTSRFLNSNNLVKSQFPLISLTKDREFI